MEHSAYKEMLSALLDGELGRAEREAALAHIGACVDCRAYFAELTALRAALGDLEEFDAPEDFAAGVMTRLRAGDATARPRAASAPKTRKGHSARRGYAALAACAAVVLLAVYALPNAPRMGGNSSATAADSASSAVYASPAEAPQALAPEPSPDYYDYAYAGGENGGDPGSMTKESALAQEEDTAMSAANNSAPSGTANSERYATTADGDMPAPSTADRGGTSMTSLSRPEAFAVEPPVLTLSGEGAEGWLAEHGWQGESGSWYADAWALRALPEGLTLSDGGVPEGYDGPVLVELGEAEP